MIRTYLACVVVALSGCTDPGVSEATAGLISPDDASTDAGSEVDTSTDAPAPTQQNVVISPLSGHPDNNTIVWSIVGTSIMVQDTHWFVGVGLTSGSSITQVCGQFRIIDPNNGISPLNVVRVDVVSVALGGPELTLGGAGSAATFDFQQLCIPVSHLAGNDTIAVRYTSTRGFPVLIGNTAVTFQ